MGVVYIIRSEAQRAVKIGYTRTESPRGRLDALQAGNPDPLTVAAIIPHGGPATEALIHHTLAWQRLRGEWFRLTPAIRRLIDRANEDPRLDVEGWSERFRAAQRVNDVPLATTYELRADEYFRELEAKHGGLEARLEREARLLADHQARVKAELAAARAYPDDIIDRERVLGPPRHSRAPLKRRTPRRRKQGRPV